MNLVLALLVVASVISFFAMSHSAQGQIIGAVIGSETIVYTFNNTTQLNGTSFEVKVSGDSSFVVLTVLVGTSSSSAVPSVSVREWRIYDSSGGEPFIYKSPDGSLSAGSDNEIRTVAGPDILPLGVPEGGSLGIALEASGLELGDQVMITFVYMTNAESMVSAELLSAAQLPFYVAENSHIENNSSNLEISDSFVDPEIHCEICTAVNGAGQVEATYITNATDLTDATKFAFWTMGESGGENVTFKIAGKSHYDTVVYANTTNIILDNEWKRYEIDLAGAHLRGITHLFGFETNSEQTFYIKGAAYY